MMDERKNIVFESVKFGFKTLVKHIFLFACLLLAAAVMKRVISVMSTFLYAWFNWSGIHSSLFHLFCIVLIVLAVCFLFVGLYKIALDMHDYGKSSVQGFFSCLILLPRVLAAFLFYIIATGIGMLLLVIPGVFIMFRCFLFPYCIIDRNVGAIESLKMSYEVTKKHGWHLFLLSIIVGVIGEILDILFVCFNVVGLVNSIGRSLFAILVYAYFYRTLVPKNSYSE